MKHTKVLKSAIQGENIFGISKNLITPMKCSYIIEHFDKNKTLAQRQLRRLAYHYCQGCFLMKFKTSSTM